MIPSLREYQTDLEDRVREQMRRGAQRIVVQAATGAGKTTSMAHIAKLATEKGRRSLILAHRRRLVDQISARLASFEVYHGVLMAGEHHHSSHLVQVASRDTMMSRCFRNEWVGLPPTNLIMIDEGHRAAPVDSDYRKIAAQYPSAVVLLFTATPVGPDGKGLGPWAQAIECAAPVSELIRDGYLVPVRCYAPDRQFNRGNAKRGIAGDLVQSWKEFAEGMPTVTFCSRVQHSLDAVQAYNEAGIPAAHVDANTDDDDRDRVFGRLETGELKVVSNVGIIKEGVDLPCLGCCQLYLDVGGRVAFLQAVGRIMRPSEGKSHGVLIDHSGACFRYGFPDEDQQWTLEGNADDAFQAKKDAGQTKSALYCKVCKLMWHGQKQCPQCGRMPAKPPRSIFAPPPVDVADELLTEAERQQVAQVFTREEKVAHWTRCVALAANSNGTFSKAFAVYRNKYNEWPGKDFPFIPAPGENRIKVRDKYPDWGKKKEPV